MRKRIFINYIIILMTSITIIGSLAYYFIETSYINSKKEKLLTNSNLIESVLKELDENSNKINFYKLAQDLSFQVNSRVTFFNIEGRVIADSMNNSIIFYPHDQTPEFQYAIRGEKKIVQRYSSEVGNKFFYLTLPPVKVGDTLVIVRLGDDYGEIDHIIENFLKYSLFSAVIGLIFAIIIGFVSVGRIVKPVNQLREASKLIAEGDFDKRIEVKTKDEIEELSISFNQMAEKLKFTIGELKEKNIKLDAILSSMQEGLIALDKGNKVISVNESAKKILEIDEIKIGAHIGDIFENVQILREIEKTIKSNKNQNVEVEIGNNTKKIIHISISVIQDQNKVENRIGTLLIIRDITSIRKLEKMRRDFVANVSHELRTPLTSIIGFTETLKTKNLEEKNKQKALNIIEIEAQRLERLINDLLRLSEIENIENVKELTDVDVTKDTYEIIELLQPLANKKDIKLSLFIDEELNTINGDNEWFRLILINLVENSIKYTEENGIVKVSLLNYQEGIRLIVEDNGVGIPKESIPRIFERFYRVDKSRSSIVEGSGLGLSIVKHLVLLFGGSIKVESELGKGSKFTVILP